MDLQVALTGLRQSAGRGARGTAAMVWVLSAMASLTGWPRCAAAVTVLDTQTFSLTPGKKIRLFDVVTPRTTKCACAAECLLAQRALAFLQRTVSQADTDRKSVV